MTRDKPRSRDKRVIRLMKDLDTSYTTALRLYREVQEEAPDGQPYDYDRVLAQCQAKLQLRKGD